MTAPASGVEAPADASWLDRLERPGVAVGICLAAYLPFVLLGYGTDIDVAAVLESGRRWIDHGDYAVSRVPGAAIHEVSTAFLDDLGGPVLVNLASVLFAGLALWGVQDLLRREGSRISGLAVLVLATNPWFWIAATSLGDFAWALGLLMAGAVACRRDHRVLGGVLFALATGCRLSTVFLAGAWLLAERIGRAESRPSVRSTMITGSITVLLGAVCFVPSWLWADRTLDFLQSESDFAGFGVHLGRWAIKNVAFFGVLAGAVLLAGLPRLRRVWPAWHTSVPFRFALLALAVTEVLYFRFPFKLVHLLPAAVAVALVIGFLGTESRRWIGVLIAAQLVGGLITTTLAAPDVEDQATSGQVELGLTAGPLLTDVRCRLDDLDGGPYDDPFADEIDRSGRNAACQLETWRANP